MKFIMLRGKPSTEFIITDQTQIICFRSLFILRIIYITFQAFGVSLH